MPFINDRLAENHNSIAQAKPRAQFNRQSRFLFEPDKVMDLLRKRIVGQADVLAAMDNLLQTVKADISSEQRPLSVNLLIGPTGSGKTETVRVIAEAIHGSSDKLCRIDMNTLAQEHYTAALTGAPPGYVGSKEGQTLLDVEAIQGSFSKPGIVLFDELEKASNEVIRALLNILDTGKLKLASGTKDIDFRNTLVFMTSNVAAKKTDLQSGWRRWFLRPVVDESHLLDHALHERFDPEFLNRIDRTLSFQRLGEQSLPALLDIELAKLQLFSILCEEVEKANK